MFPAIPLRVHVRRQDEKERDDQREQEPVSVTKLRGARSGTVRAAAVALVAMTAACGRMGQQAADVVGRAMTPDESGPLRAGWEDMKRQRANVRPGITVLLSDSIGMIRGRRVGLITNQTGIDEHGVSDIE